MHDHHSISYFFQIRVNYSIKENAFMRDKNVQIFYCIGITRTGIIKNLINFERWLPTFMFQLKYQLSIYPSQNSYFFLTKLICKTVEWKQIFCTSQIKFLGYFETCQFDSTIGYFSQEVEISTV